MAEENKSKYPNFVAIEGDGNYPQLYCPVCGKGITPTHEGCAHLLFECAYSNLEKDVLFNYLHPKFRKTTDAIEEELYGTHPSDVASKLNLNPETTFVLKVRNLLERPAFAELVKVVVGIEFPPESEALKTYKLPRANHS